MFSPFDDLLIPWQLHNFMLFNSTFSNPYLFPTYSFPTTSGPQGLFYFALVWKFGLCVSNKSSRVMMPLPGDSWAHWQLKLPVWISGMAWVVPGPPSQPAGMQGGEERGGTRAGAAGLTLSPVVWSLGPAHCSLETQQSEMVCFCLRMKTFSVILSQNAHIPT